MGREGSQIPVIQWNGYLSPLSYILGGLDSVEGLVTITVEEKFSSGYGGSISIEVHECRFVRGIPQNWTLLCATVGLVIPGAYGHFDHTHIIVAFADGDSIRHPINMGNGTS